jgi:hypothetical protein
MYSNDVAAHLGTQNSRALNMIGAQGDSNTLVEQEAAGPFTLVVEYQHVGKLYEHNPPLTKTHPDGNPNKTVSFPGKQPVDLS